jgi:hypothetical protein
MILPICFAGGREEVGLREVSLHRLQRRPRPDQRQHQRRRGADPAEAGASCEAWDAKNHPDCLGGWVKMLGKITSFKSYK